MNDDSDKVVGCVTIGLPCGWANTKLDDVADILDFERQPINSSERNERISGKNNSELFAYYGATGQVGWIDGYRTEGQRILLGEDGAPFLDPSKDKAFLVNGRFWVNNHAHVLQGAAGLIDNRFLCYQLNMVDYQPHVSGSTRLKLTNSAMKQISLLVAPANEQTRIVEKLEELLSDLDAGVAELKAAQKKLVQYRQSLLKAAVEGALTAEWRTANQPKETGTQLLERILIERRARWEVKQLAKFKEQGKAPPKDWQAKYPEPVKPDTNDLPELPEGWIWASLDQVASTVRNGLSQKPSQEPIGYPILRINAVRPMSVNLNEVRYLALAETTVTEYILENGDILATRYNGSVDLLGVFGVVRGLTTQTLHPDKLIRIKPVLDSKLADWIEICAAIGESRRHIVSRVKTTAGQTGISGEDVKKMPIPLAPLLEQEFVIERLTTSIQEISSQGYAVDTSLKQSALQRKNILKAAFSGQLVPQDSNDEPAIFLLERIQAERSVQAASKMPLGRKRKQLA